MEKETLIYNGDAKWSRRSYIKFVDNKVIFDCSDDEYGPLEFDTDLLVKAYREHYDIDMGGLENEPPYVSDDFQIGPDGAYEHTEEVQTIQIQQELIDLLYSQVIDLTMMSKIELGDDVIAEIKRLNEIIKIGEKENKTMTPKEKAEQLVKKYYRDSDLLFEDLSFIQAKQCALICIDEIIDALAEYDDRNNTYELQNMDRDFNYWEKVKQEIELL